MLSSCVFVAYLLYAVLKICPAHGLVQDFERGGPVQKKVLTFQKAGWKQSCYQTLVHTCQSLHEIDFLAFRAH